MLGFWDSVAAILLFNILGGLPTAFFSTLGPKLGLRQMTISRFSFGVAGASVMALFNVVTCVGWSAVSVIIGAKMISALSRGRTPFWAGVIVIALLTMLVSLYGYRYVHRYERIAWVPMAAIFLVVACVAGPHVHFLHTPTYHVAQWASFLSFGAAVFGAGAGWSSCAADYNVNQPEGPPARRVFWLTFLGVVIPCAALEVLGLMLSTAFAGGDGPDLLAASLAPLHGFGTLLLFLLALSIIANNIPNDYSLGLSLQVVSRRFQRVSRAAWTLVGAVAYVLIALAAPKNFNDTLEGFLLLVAYWLSPWSAILILEHFVFRKGRYNGEDWDTPGRLPVGWAALVVMAAGLFGVFLGVAQAEFAGQTGILFRGPAPGYREYLLGNGAGDAPLDVTDAPAYRVVTGAFLPDTSAKVPPSAP